MENKSIGTSSTNFSIQEISSCRKVRSNGSIDINNSLPFPIRHYIPDAFIENNNNKNPYGIEKEILIATEVAYEAGQSMIHYYEEKGTFAEQYHELQITGKGTPTPTATSTSTSSQQQQQQQSDVDFCTNIDIENEQLITNRLLEHFPTHTIIGEEMVGATGTIPPIDNNTPTWIIDPIDGTTNFVAGIPYTCVSIGLCIKGVPILGIVYIPIFNELYIAVHTMGAYRNGVQILPLAKPSRTLQDAVVCYEMGYVRDTKGIDQMIHVLQNILYVGCRTTRSLGSGVLDLCYVATGRIDVVYTGVATEGWKPWDYCAALVIVLESGCTIETIYDNNNTTTTRTAATNNNHDDDDDQTILSNDETVPINNTTAPPPCYKFNIYSSSMICAVNPLLVNEVRNIILQTVTPPSKK